MFARGTIDSAPQQHFLPINIYGHPTKRSGTFSDDF